jgi:type II secretion system protein J
MTLPSTSRAGFTLVETLAAVAIAAAVIVSAGALIHDSVFFFDRGTRSVDQTEQFALAIDCLTRDFGAARFALQSDQGKTRSSFTAGEHGDILFITGGGRGPGAARDEIVRISIEQDDASRKIVRRRLAWKGPRQRPEEAELRDPVILLKGPFDISFEFSKPMATGGVAWQDQWTGETGLPQAVRLTLRDAATGAILLKAGEFPVHANAPIGCAIGKEDCLAIANAPAVAGNGAAGPQQAAAKL